MIKKLIKKTALYKVILCLRLNIDIFYYLSLISGIKAGKYKDAVFLLGTVLHKNNGDHLITYAELCFLERNLPLESEVIQIPIEVYLLFGKTITKYLPKDAIVFINGGGWMGELWPEHEELMQDMVRNCENHKIIIFPQTIFYQNNNSELLQKAKQVYNLPSCLTICVRDCASYDFAMRYFYKSRIILLPDITLSLGDKDLRKLMGDSKPDREFIGACIRNDRECNNNKTALKVLDSVKKEHDDIQVINVSTIASRRIREKGRINALSKVFRKYMKCKLVLTDRLHSMIICYLTKTPCVVWDNATHKVEGTYTKWLSDCDNVFYANIANEHEIKAFIEKILNQTTYGGERKEFDFSNLKRAINNG